ncbi:hypothetical protein [Micromonospora sp. RL09-050-HVF-A]|uniref:hypothetical protein n=1 Tax=Micromonospora sp. RL09-050-HVF-A TaxID=1703433 RepID=UPI0027E292DE|nr:hypothetical protein [Micromonospora sp. RL09-050-HVF-A]
MPDNEMAEFHQRATAAMTAAIQAASQLAQLLIEVRIVQLQRAARASEEQARQTRAQARAAQQADAAVWRPAMRPGWWRTAGTEDIAQVWRAASTWQHVDPRAQQARQVVVDQLAKRTGQAGGKPEPAREPDDIEVLSDAVDRAVSEATDRAGRPAMTEEAVRDRQERMAAEVRKAWPSGQRADRVLECEAWGALAYTLDQAQQAGHDVQQLLRGVPGFVDRARTPAAFACRVVQDQLAGRIDLGTVTMDRDRGEAQDQSARPEESSRMVLSAVEQAGIRRAGGVDGERLRAAAVAYWTERKQTADRIDSESTSRETIKQVTYAVNRLAAYRRPQDTMRVFGGEQPADQTEILARVDRTAESPVAGPAVTTARAFPVSTQDAVAAPQASSEAEERGTVASVGRSSSPEVPGR